MENRTEIIIYQTDDGLTKIETRLENETVWLTQAQMAELFEKGRSTITEHINHIFQEGELDEESVCRKFRHTASDGKSYESKVEEDFIRQIEQTAKQIEKAKKENDKL